LDNYDNTGRKVCCKVSLYTNCQRQSCSAVDCLSSGINILAGGQPLPPEILAPSDLPLLKALNKNSTWDFQQAINQGSMPPLLPQNGDKLPKFVVFWTISTIKDEKSAAKFHYIQTVSGKVVAQSIVFRVVSIYWQGDDPFPLTFWLQVTYPLLKAASFQYIFKWYQYIGRGSSVPLISECKGTDPHWKHLRCTHFAS